MQTLYKSFQVIFLHALRLVNGKDFSRAMNIFPCYTRKACVYVRTCLDLLQFHLTKSAQATNVSSFRPFCCHFCCPFSSTRVFASSSSFLKNVSGYLTVTLFPEKAGKRCCAESAMGTLFVRPVVEACVSNTPNFGLITSVRWRHSITNTWRL